VRSSVGQEICLIIQCVNTQKVRKDGRYTKRPFFLGFSFFIDFNNIRMANVQQVAAQTVEGLGYELVELERSAGGMLRVTIDHPWTAGQPAQLVTVEDCERVTRQLQYVLEVENVDYKRLEVASPGIDRPLRNETDLQRFEGEVIDLTLKAPLGAELANAAADLSANRKKFRGVLGRSESGGWQIVLSEDADRVQHGPASKTKAKKKAQMPAVALGFELNELKEARLAPIVDFKGRKSRVPDNVTTGE
jgi:ribosome maturation factor RimP